MSAAQFLRKKGNSSEKSKTHKFILLQKNNKLSEIEQVLKHKETSNINKRHRGSLILSNENLDIPPFFLSDKKEIFANNEEQKNKDIRQNINLIKNKRPAKFSPIKINSLFKTLKINKNNSINNNLNTAKSKISNRKNEHLYPKKNKNYINFVDRNKIRNIKLTSLNILNQYLGDENDISSENKIENNKNKKSEKYKEQQAFNSGPFTTLNLGNNIHKKLSLLKKVKPNLELTIDSENSLKASKSKFNRTLKKLSLHELMEINPYHYVSNTVKYSKVIEMGLISEKLGDMNGGNNYLIEKNKLNFFRGKSSNKAKYTRVIDTFKVSYNENLLNKSGLIWRILKKIYSRRKSINPSFKLACKFKAYTELWKFHSMLIEKLLVNYGKFKWFLEKDRYMREEVFHEFLECKKLETKSKGEITFSQKVFLTFDELGIGLINIKLFFLIMEITSNSNNKTEKINFICDLVEEYQLINEPNSINILDMYDLFKYLLVYENAQKDGKLLLESIKEDLNCGEKLDLNIYINKKDLYDFLRNNKYFHKIIQGFKIQYKYAEIAYMEEINSSFNSTVRNVKKFLNEQNEVISNCDRNYYKFEQILKSIQLKNDNKEKMKILVDELENENKEEEQE